VLGLCLDWLDPTVHHLIVQLGQIVALLQTLDVLLGELVRVLVEALRMMYIDIRIIIVNDHDPATARQLFHVLRIVRRVLLLLLLVDVVLVQRLLRHAHLVGADPPVVAGRLLWAVGRRDVGALARPLLHRALVHALLRVFQGRALERGRILRHHLPLDLAGRLVLKSDLAPMVTGLQLVLLGGVGRLDLRLPHH